LCVIATDVGSDGEALQGAGIVIDPGNLDAQLRLALEMTLTYPEFRRHLGQLARQRAVERFTMQENIRRLTELYHLVRTSYVREGE
jgi:glycosyltransferase involved in cell wall biosynthesis